ncbi:MAG: glycosyltransferase family 2 protein [Candidatus Methanofastidiosa archaeon]|nr:glycosyltransferase family 2 protein [Candidatus Methanofastidiosa archaeon]
MTKECVDSLLKFSNELNILIIDNGSTDSSFNELENEYKFEKKVKLIETGSNLGYAKGNNYAFKYIRKNFTDIKYVIVMNPDIVIDKKETIVALYDFLESNDDYSIVSCQTIFNDTWRGFLDYGWKYPSNKNLYWAGTFIGKLFIEDMNERYSCINVSEETLATTVDVVSGCFFMAKLEDLEQVELFDNRTFLYYEENILSRKLSSIDKKEAILLNRFVYHNHQSKDKNLVDYKKRLFDRKCFHESKMIYVNNYSSFSGMRLILCNLINNIDFCIKTILYKILILLRL